MNSVENIVVCGELIMYYFITKMYGDEEIKFSFWEEKKTNKKTTTNKQKKNKTKKKNKKTKQKQTTTPPPLLSKKTKKKKTGTLTKYFFVFSIIREDCDHVSQSMWWSSFMIFFL